MSVFASVAPWLWSGTSAPVALQGRIWSNGDGGFSIAQNVHGRLQRSKRVVTDPSDADLFFIPMHARQSCFASWYHQPFAACGVDYSLYSKHTRFWSWMHQQPSFQASDGSDHFIIAAQNFPVFTKGRVRVLTSSQYYRTALATGRTPIQT